MIVEDESETQKSADDIKTGFVQSAVEQIEKQSALDKLGQYLPFYTLPTLYGLFDWWDQVHFPV